jgi:hypothetical protein
MVHINLLTAEVIDVRHALEAELTWFAKPVGNFQMPVPRSGPFFSCTANTCSRDGDKDVTLHCIALL